MRYVRVLKSDDWSGARKGVWPLISNNHVATLCSCGCGQFLTAVVVPDEYKPAKKSDFSENIIFGGVRRDGHPFGLFKKGRKITVRAGCRQFSLKDARAHWGSSAYSRPSLGAWALKCIDKMERKAKRRGWFDRPNKSKKSVARKKRR